MKKEETSVKRKPNWKFWVLLTIIFTLLSILIVTFIFFDTVSWINMVLLPMIISLVAGAGISLFFTIKTDKERLVDELQKEIEEVLERTIYLPRILMEVVQNPLQSTVLKKQILTQEMVKMPSMIRVREVYRELWILYKEKRDKIVSEINKWNDQDKLDEFMRAFQVQYGPAIMMHIIEISDCALKVQEQYYQDFKGEAKKPIPAQLIFEVESAHNKKPN